MSNTHLLPLWHQAADARLGTVISVTGGKIRSAILRMYAARDESGDESLKLISIHQSPTNPEGEFWLVKRNPIVNPRNEDGPARD